MKARRVGWMGSARGVAAICHGGTYSVLALVIVILGSRAPEHDGDEQHIREQPEDVTNASALLLQKTASPCIQRLAIGAEIPIS